MESIETEVARMQTQLDQRARQLNEFVADGKQVENGAKSVHDWYVEQLRSAYKRAQGKLDQRNAATADHWETSKARADTARSLSWSCGTAPGSSSASS